ncbi:MAG TPA: hypothetical protein PKX91_03720 [Clostridia bacterium]|jgi:flagellar basal body-associated protein FliL|nr:hypothetical protein [Clostridia bacterium]
MTKEKNKIIIVLVISLAILTLCLVGFWAGEVDSAYATENTYQKVEWSHNKTGMGKFMVERNFSKEMQLEKVNGGYILYTKLDTSLMNNYSMEFLQSGIKLNMAILDRVEDTEIYGAFIKEEDLNKTILIKLFVPAMNKNIDIEIQLGEMTSGSYEVYDKATQQKYKPGEYRYEFKQNGEILTNQSFNVGEIKKDIHKLSTVQKVNYDGTTENVSNNNIRYLLEVTTKDNKAKKYNFNGSLYDEEINKINFSEIAVLKICYYAEGVDLENTNANTFVVSKYVLDESLTPDERSINLQDEDILISNPNYDEGNSVNVMALTIGLVVGIVALAIVVFVVVIVIKNRRAKGKNSKRASSE